MFSYDSLEGIRNLEMFLGFEPECNTGCCNKTSLRESEMMFNERHSEPDEKSNFFDNLKNYFTGNSNVWYTVSLTKKTKEISYIYPKSFTGDLNNIKSYFSKFVKRN
jgi:hypothetical protein